MEKEPIKVNELLGKQPSIGPLPANQILPLAMIIIGSYFLLDGLLDLGFIIVGLVSFWWGTTWLLLTGKDPDKYLNLFRKPPHHNWTIGGTLYISPLWSRKVRLKLKKQVLKEQKRR